MGAKKVTDKRKGRDMFPPHKKSLWWGAFRDITFQFLALASRNPAAGLGQEAVHGSHCNGIS